MLSFAAAVLFLIITPGPGVLSTAGVGSGFGFRAGLGYVGGLFLGAMAARYFTSINQALWYALAAPIVGLIGYLLGYINAGMGWAVKEGYQYYINLATTPPHDLVRPLPIEYVAVGVAAAIAGFWTGHRLQEAVVEETGS